jgi:uncharacterized membrane protein HdeD (DUF308 family)
MNLFTLQQPGRNYWWVLLIRGIVAVLFGILALGWPGRTVLFLIYLFGIYALVEGMMTVVGSLRERQTYSRWWVQLIGGIAGIIIGLLVFFWPEKTALVLFTLAGIWAIVTGLFHLIAAFAFPAGLGLGGMLALSGILLVIVGAVFILHPVASIMSLVWVLGLFAILYGIVLCVRAFQYRSSYRSSVS